MFAYSFNVHLVGDGFVHCFVSENRKVVWSINSMRSFSSHHGHLFQKANSFTLLMINHQHQTTTSCYLSPAEDADVERKNALEGKHTETKSPVPPTLSSIAFEGWYNAFILKKP